MNPNTVLFLTNTSTAEIIFTAVIFTLIAVFSISLVLVINSSIKEARKNRQERKKEKEQKALWEENQKQKKKK